MLLAALLLLAAWVAVAALIEGAAWRAERLGARGRPASFGAPPRVASGAPVARIAFLGDLQRGVSDVAPPLAEVLRDRKPDLLVSSGDFVAHGEAPYYGVLIDAFDRAGIDVPLRAVPGNHDLFPRRVRDASLGGALFESRIGPRRWIERVGPVLVVGIDDATQPVEGDALHEIRRALEAEPGVPWIAVCHRPPRNVEEPDARAEADLGALVRLLEARPPLLLVCGHKHEPMEREVNGVRYVVNALGGDVHGSGLRRGPFEVLHVEVSADGVSRRETTRHRRRSSPRTLWNQLCVRLWTERRLLRGRIAALPATIVLSVLGRRAPERHPARPWQPPA